MFVVAPAAAAVAAAALCIKFLVRVSCCLAVPIWWCYRGSEWGSYCGRRFCSFTWIYVLINLLSLCFAHGLSNWPLAFCRDSTIVLDCCFLQLHRNSNRLTECLSYGMRR